MWEAHQRFGKLKWSKLFQPAIELAKNGIPLNSYVHKHMRSQYELMDKELKSTFTNPVSGHMKEIGDLIKMPALAETLQRIANEGVDTFYRGSLRDDILADLEEIGKVLLNSLKDSVLV